MESGRTCLRLLAATSTTRLALAFVPNVRLLLDQLREVHSLWCVPSNQEQVGPAFVRRVHDDEIIVEVEQGHTCLHIQPSCANDVVCSTHPRASNANRGVSVDERGCVWWGGRKMEGSKELAVLVQACRYSRGKRHRGREEKKQRSGTCRNKDTNDEHVIRNVWERWSMNGGPLPSDLTGNNARNQTSALPKRLETHTHTHAKERLAQKNKYIRPLPALLDRDLIRRKPTWIQSKDRTNCAQAKNGALPSIRSSWDVTPSHAKESWTTHLSSVQRERAKDEPRKFEERAAR